MSPEGKTPQPPRAVIPVLCHLHGKFFLLLRWSSNSFRFNCWCQGSALSASAVEAQEPNHSSALTPALHKLPLLSAARAGEPLGGVLGWQQCPLCCRCPTLLSVACAGPSSSSVSSTPPGRLPFVWTPTAGWDLCSGAFAGRILWGERGKLTLGWL